MPWFNRGKLEVLSGDTDLRDATIKLALMKTSYTLDIDLHLTWSQVSANELTASGYVAGGVTLSNKAFVQNNTSDRAEFTTDPVAYPALATGDTIHGAILYRDTGTPATSPLVTFYDLPNTPTNGSMVTVQFASNIALTLT